MDVIKSLNDLALFVTVKLYYFLVRFYLEYASVVCSLYTVDIDKLERIQKICFMYVAFKLNVLYPYYITTSTLSIICLCSLEEGTIWTCCLNYYAILLTLLNLLNR